MEVIGVRDVDAVFVSKKSFRVGGPVAVGQICKVDGNWMLVFAMRVHILRLLG